MNFHPTSFDVNLLRLINGFHYPWLDPVMVFIANISEYAIIWVLIGLYFFVTNKKYGKKLFFTLLLTMAIEALINDGLLKNLLFRERPYLLLQNIHHLGPDWTNSSFISGHTASSTISLIILIKYFKKILKNSYLTYILYSIFYILILWSRLYLGMHYPSDILGGMVVGIIAAWSAFALIKKTVISMQC